MGLTPLKHLLIIANVFCRVPWLIEDGDGPESCTSVLRKFTELKCRLMPYLYSESLEAIKHGWPTSVRPVSDELSGLHKGVFRIREGANFLILRTRWR